MIGIVGGGISGLAVAHHLRAHGAPFTLFEADQQVGGVMRTVSPESSVAHGVPADRTADPLPLDVGPQRTRLTEDVRALVEGAGLTSSMVEAPEDALPLFVYRKGRLREAPLDLAAAIRTDALSLGEKVRVLMEPLTAGPRPEESVQRFFTRKFGRGAYEALIGPLYGGLYASDPAHMYVRHGLSMTLDHFGVSGSLLWALLRRGATARSSIPTVSFTEGMQMLPLHLGASFGDSVQTGRRVVTIHQRGSTKGGPESDRLASYELELEDGERVDVDQIVLSLPSAAASELLTPVAPEAAGKLAALRENRLAVVHLMAVDDGSARTPLRGLGYQVAFGEELETRGVTWNGAMFDRETLCSVYLGGMKNPRLVDWEDQRIAEVATSEFRAVTGWGGEVLRVSRTSIPAWDGSWDALDALRLPPAVHLCANWNARPGIPGRATAARRLAERLVASRSSS